MVPRVAGQRRWNEMVEEGKVTWLLHTTQQTKKKKKKKKARRTGVGFPRIWSGDTISDNLGSLGVWRPPNGPTSHHVGKVHA
jgi:hypothetical protein